MGNTDGALTTLQPYVAGRQLPGFFALQAALIADMSGRTDLAASLYQAARVGNGTPPLRLAQVIASFDARTNHQAQALQALDAVADAAPLLQLALPGMAAHLREPAVATPLQGVAETLVGFSAALHQDGDDRMSILMLRLALMVRPDLSAARLLAADVLELQQDLAGAIDVLAPVPESDALAPVVRVREAELTARNGQPDQALAMLSALASQIPDSSAPDSEAGDVLRMKGDWQGAIVAYSRAIARMGQPSAIDWPVFYDRGIAYSQTGDWAQAQADFEHALQLQPDQPLVLNYLGYSWADRGEHLAQARDMLETAAHLQPGDGEIIDSLGWVMLRQGDATQAVDMLERAAELEPADATINAHLGDAYWAAGRKTEAAYQWRRALIFNPPPADAAKIEAKLHDTTAQASTETPSCAERVRSGQGQSLPACDRPQAGRVHLLDSLTVFAGVGDVLRAEVDATIGLSIDGPFAAGLSAGEDNLVHRAALRLAGSEHGSYPAADAESSSCIGNRRRFGRCGGGVAHPGAAVGH